MEAEKNTIKESIIAKIMEASVESRTDDTFESELSKEGNKEDTLTDYDDAEVRDGKKKYASQYKEAIKQKILGVQEGIADEADAGTVPDSIQTNSAANNIVPDVDTQSNDSIQPASESVDYIKNKIIEKTVANETTNFIKNRILNSVNEDSVEEDGIVYKGWLTSVTEAKSKKGNAEDMLEDEDDADIEAIANSNPKTSELSLDVDYSDDELIDMAINGQV
jgi:hypothetical protein